MDNEYRKGFRIKVPKDIDLEQDMSKLRHAIFVNNIMTNMWIWKALCFDTQMNNNFTVIKSLLAPTNPGDDVCGICVKQDGDCLSSFIDKLVSISLNQSQVDAIRSVISAEQCKHMNLIKLIWGPPGAGKTKMVSALLWALACLKCRTLTCAPTNVAVTGVCTRFLQNLKDFTEHIDENGLPVSLGDVLLFGNKYNMDITEDLHDVFLDFRVEELVRCFSRLSGWEYRLASMVSFFEDCGSGSQYDMLIEDDGSGDPMCFSDFLKKQYDVIAKGLIRCIMNLWIHLPGRCFSCDSISSISKLFNMLKKIDALLCDVNLTDESLKRVLGGCSTGKSVCGQPIPFIEKELDGARSACLILLKNLQQSLNLPSGVDRNWVQRYCMRNATLIFCTTSSSYRLHHMEITPLDVLIVDEAAQVWECELVIPLRLHGLKHVVLAGDDCQLNAMVKSQVCKEAGFGTSLFQRLVKMNFEKHLLNIQYRMDPCIGLFPIAQFYGRKILDGPNVLSSLYNKEYTSLPFGSYTFINVVDGREDREGTRKSWRNMVEVAVVLHLIQTIFNSWERSGQGLSIGVVSPYSSQVDEIKRRLGNKYDTCDGFHVRIKSIDAFQGEEDDVIILSTVRSNGRGAVGFLADSQRTNVALTRARHCLWIVGNANTLSKGGTVWTDIVVDARRRNCIFNATNDATMCKLILQVKQDLDELDDLLNADSVVFSNTRWKVILSDMFRKSYIKIKSRQLRREVLQKLVKLGAGWRTSFKNVGICDTFQLARVWKIRDLYLVWSTDIEKSERGYFQIIRIWDLLSHQHVARTVQRLENLFSIYTDDYLDHCRRVQTDGKLEVPLIWDVEHHLVRYKKDCTVGAQKDHDFVDRAYAMENSKVTESFLLMKFYSLSSGVAKQLLSTTDGSQIDIPFELTDEEEAVIRFPHTSFILGRSGTGKTTVLTMKLIQIEQRSLIASQGLNVDNIDLPGVDDKNIMPLKETCKRERFVKQVFITVSPKLCSAIKNQICRLKRFGSGDVSDQPSILQMHDIIDDLEEFTEIPDKFSDVPCEYYPLTITYRKFLMMLDGTCRTSFFDGFYAELKSIIEGAHSKSLALQILIELKEVTYEKFVSSYWPHFNTELTKKLDASSVFTEIISHIKGGYQANRPSSGGKLERQDYLKLSDKRASSLNSEKRGRIYDIFLDYESMKGTAREFDLSDFVNSLHSSLVSEGYKGDMVDFVYIDEVQDFTMAQIALLKYVCRNFKEGFLFAGDTAQTIAKGVDFRFEDIRLLFYTTFLSDTEVCNKGIEYGKQVHLSDMFQLTQNFRTHCGILRMAQSIMNLLYYFFPSSVDKLNPETGLIHGEAPLLLESGNGENAIMTIFGENESKHGNLHGFGAEQVVLVRDGVTKKRIVDLVGKQALVLTIVECKGLEFQDVLLYNFFSSSPLKNKWRVLYGCMKEKDIIASSEKISYPGFDRTKHHLLCSELKQLYVAITRTRQRLWICESTDDYCRPMFDYWKKLCLVEVRLLDSSFIQAMQTGSSSDDWRLRGIKLFNERQFEMATMCFEKAGDTYREKWARAAGFLATADRVISTNLEMGQASLQKASEIYESIGMHEKAAACYTRLGDYESAGIAKHKGDVLLEADRFDKAESRGIFHMAQSIRSLLHFFFPSSVHKLDSETRLAHGETPVLLESGNDENAIMNIFGVNKSKHGSLHGFGAEQVILVRDVATKKYIVDLVGKQALVLTIVECKGLEFQDVLLYNFFSSSPLRNKWSFVYDYMKEEDGITSSEEISHLDLGRSKPDLLCSELKQLYVAITRSRRRLWLCEDTNDYSQPMFDYWKKLRLLEVRLLDSPLVQKMKTASSTDDWGLQGTKLFDEGQFEMATVCFEKAGDTYKEKWARAAGLLATADRVISTNLEMSQAVLQNASDIYESIGMYDKVATCYIKLGDYEAAGMVYMQKCGTSRLEDAGDCYAMIECWLQAAEAYLKAKCYTKCFSMCLKGKLFILGLQFLQQLKEECMVENSECVELSAVRKMYLENCAQHYFERGDIKNMMPFIKAFGSMDHARAFLNSRNLADELLKLKMEVGCFPEAAGIEKDDTDVLQGADMLEYMLESTGQYTDATDFVVCGVVSKSLRSSNRSMSWSNAIAVKTIDMANAVRACCFCYNKYGSRALKCEPKSLAILSCAFLVGRECGNLLIELVGARFLLGVHLQSEASGYNLGLAGGSQNERCRNDMLSCNQISPETLLYVWDHWRSIVVKVLSHLRHSDGQESNDCAVTYDDLCARYFGLRKDGDNDRYLVPSNMNSSYLSDLAGRGFLHHDGNIGWMDSIQFHSYVQTFWMHELHSISLTVLNKLSCIQFSPKQASSYALGRTILIMYEVAMFLKEPEFGLPKSTIIKLRSFFVQCERRFFEFLSHVWRDGTVKPLLSVLELPTAYGLITDSLGAYLRPTNKKLTHGHLGRVAMFLLYVGRCTSRQSDDLLFSGLLQYLDKESEWANFFRSLKIFIYGGGLFGRSPLILNFKLALESTMNANWMAEPDCISPVCYADLIEFLGFFASSYSLPNGCVFCAKSEWVCVLRKIYASQGAKVLYQHNIPLQVSS
ncbi:hypothetical protein ACQJBY_017559 [Aegilops geniculata]